MRNNDQEAEAWKFVLFLAVSLAIIVVFAGWYGIMADRQHVLEMAKSSAWFQKYKNVAPHLEVFMRTNDNGEVVYSVAENKTLWLEGKVPILFESRDPWEATKWAIDHTCIVYLENVNLTLKRPLPLGKHKAIVLKENASICFVADGFPPSLIIAVAVVAIATLTTYIINKHFIIKIEVKRRR